MKDKDGNQITTKEFFSRWKQGIKEVDIKTTSKIQLRSHYLILVGLVVGVIVSCFNFKSLWWLVLVLIGSAILELVTIRGLKEQLKLLSTFDDYEEPEVIIKNGL